MRTVGKAVKLATELAQERPRARMAHVVVRTDSSARDRPTEIVAPSTATVAAMPHTAEPAVKLTSALAPLLFRLLPQFPLPLRPLHQHQHQHQRQHLLGPQSVQMDLAQEPVVSRVKDPVSETAVPNMVSVEPVLPTVEQAVKVALGRVQYRQPMELVEELSAMFARDQLTATVVHSTAIVALMQRIVGQAARSILEPARHLWHPHQVLHPLLHQHPHRRHQDL